MRSSFNILREATSLNEIPLPIVVSGVSLDLLSISEAVKIEESRLQGGKELDDLETRLALSLPDENQDLESELKSVVSAVPERIVWARLLLRDLLRRWESTSDAWGEVESILCSLDIVDLFPELIRWMPTENPVTASKSEMYQHLERFAGMAWCSAGTD